MSVVINKIREYNNEVNRRIGKGSDGNNLFRIRNKKDSVLIGESEFGRIGLDGDKLKYGGIRCLTVGTTGSGKTWTTRNIIEKIYEKNEESIIIIDVEGEFYTLREQYDFLILGTNETFADIVITNDNMEDVIHYILKYKMNVILDCFDSHVNEFQNIVGDFLQELLRFSKKENEESRSIVIFIEEVAKLAKKANQTASNIKCRDALKDIAQTGRKHGICTFFSTQRVTQLHNDVSAECDTYIIGKCIKPTDIERNAKFMGLRGKEAEVLKTLKYEFFIYGAGTDFSNEYESPVKFKSYAPKSEHKRTLQRNKDTFPQPSDVVKKWIELINNPIARLASEENEAQNNKEDEDDDEDEWEDDDQEIEEFEQNYPKQKPKQNPVTISFNEINPSEVSVTPPIRDYTDEDVKAIVGFFHTLPLKDLHILLKRNDMYNLIAWTFEATLFCKKNPDFVIENEIIKYIGDDIFKCPISSQEIVDHYKSTIPDKDFVKILHYMYSTKNEEGRIDKLQSILAIRNVYPALHEYEDLNLIYIKNRYVELNEILLFDSENSDLSDEEDEDEWEEDDINKGIFDSLEEIDYDE